MNWYNPFSVFYLNILITALILSFGFKKHKYWYIAIFVAAGCYSFLLFCPTLKVWCLHSGYLEAFVLLMCTLAIIYKQSFKKTLMIATVAYALQNIAANLYIIVVRHLANLTLPLYVMYITDIILSAIFALIYYYAFIRRIKDEYDLFVGSGKQLF